jgi:hypothetical protein
LKPARAGRLYAYACWNALIIQKSSYVPNAACLQGVLVSTSRDLIAQKKEQTVSTIPPTVPAPGASKTQRNPRPKIPPPKLALTIPEFCDAHGISQAYFYVLQKAGHGPRITHLGRRCFISLEDAARWRKERALTAI